MWEYPVPACRWCLDTTGSRLINIHYVSICLDYIRREVYANNMITIEFLRHYRVFGYAIFDLSVSFLGMGMLSPLLSWLFHLIKVEIPKRNWLLLTLPLGILVHLLVGTVTPMTKNFLDLNSNYILKILIVGLFILGMRGIKMIKKSAGK